MAGVNRKAPRLGDAKFSYTDSFNIAAATHIYAGEMVSLSLPLDTVAPATNAAGFVVLGVATEEVNNSVSGLVLPWVSTGIHGMTNSSVNAITRDNISDVCYVEDAATVSLSGTAIAGVIADVDANFVYVDFDPGKRAR